MLAICPLTEQPSLFRKKVDDAAGDLAGEPDRQQGDQPEHRAAVGEQEKDRDHADRGAQQRAVQAGEGVDEVGRVSGLAGDPDIESGRRACCCRLPYVVDGLTQDSVVGCGRVQRDGEGGRLPVGGLGAW